MNKAYSILHPKAIYQQGQRKNNEDCIYPALGAASSKDNFFMVCDGVGGHEKGEVASALLCQYFPEFITDCQGDFEEGYIEDGLGYVESKFAALIEEKEEVKGMASTMTLIHIHHNKVHVAWVGDSRIYQIRDGEIVFKSKDHSLVQDLVNMGEITEEEAKVHPKRNIITRSVNGVEPARVDVQELTDVQTDDFFLLCTDGILETLDEAEFDQLFRLEADPFDTKQQIFAKAEGNTKDNFSMYLIKMGEMQKSKSWISTIFSFGK